MRITVLSIWLLFSSQVFGQETVAADHSTLGSISVGKEPSQVEYLSNGESIFTPGSPFLDSLGRIIFYKALNGQSFLILDGKRTFSIPYKGNLSWFRETGSRQLFSQQGILVDVLDPLIFDTDGIIEYHFEDKIVELKGSGLITHPAPFGAIVYSDKEKSGAAIVFDILNPKPAFSIVAPTQLRSWLPTQPGGFRIGDDGLLYRNGMLWSAKIPKGKENYEWGYLGRLMSGHVIWGNGDGAFSDQFHLTAPDGKVELILTRPSWRFFNYGIGPWGEIYCLIGPESNQKGRYNPPAGSTAELVVVRNHLKFFGRLNADGVRLRQEPSTAAAILATYPAKTGFRILGQGGNTETINGKTSNWTQVRMLDGKEGWVFGAFVHNLYDGPNGSPPPWPNVPDW